MIVRATPQFATNLPPLSGAKALGALAKHHRRMRALGDNIMTRAADAAAVLAQNTQSAGNPTGAPAGSAAADSPLFACSSWSDLVANALNGGNLTRDQKACLVKYACEGNAGAKLVLSPADLASCAKVVNDAANTTAPPDRSWLLPLFMTVLVLGGVWIAIS